MKLDSPAFRSPPRIGGVDRSIQRRKGATIVAIRRDDRPLPAIQADIIDGVIATNDLSPDVADRFRRLAWSQMDAHGVLQSPLTASEDDGAPVELERPSTDSGQVPKPIEKDRSSTDGDMEETPSHHVQAA